VVIGPGSLYTSIMPNLLVPGVKEALINSKSLKIYICNIMTQQGETDGFRVSDHLKAIFGHMGGKVIDYVFANNKAAAPEVLRRYAKERAYPVEIDKWEVSRLGVKLVEGAFFREGKYIRHSPELLAKMIMKRIIV
jgi:uncharacterized cofD-like protein